jgi:hypothetical protein
MNRKTGHMNAGLRRRVGADAVAESQVCSGRSTRRAFLLVALGLASSTLAQPGQVEKRDMDLVGYNDLQARSAYQPVIQRQGNRFNQSVVQ